MSPNDRYLRASGARVWTAVLLLLASLLCGAVDPAAAAVPAAPGSSPTPNPSSNPAPRVSRHAAAVPSQLAGHRHASLCPAPQPRHVSCKAVVDLDVGGEQVSPDLSPYGYGPADLQVAYGLPSATAGVGKTVAVVNAYDHPNAEADLATYRAKYNLPPCTSESGCFRKVDQRGVTSYPPMDPGWSQEISLDLDMVSAACPNCRILLVEADSTYMDDLGLSVNTAVRLGADAVSNSYGTTEFDSQPAYDAAYYNHPGVPITVSAGDSGYGAEYPASSSYVTAVGGTTLRQDAVTGVWSETAWAAGGSGCSAYEPKPSWQRDTGCPNRTVGDIAAVADSHTGVSIYVSIPYNGLSGWEVIGGTSAGAPLVAAAYAMAGKPTTDYPSSLSYTAPNGLFDPVSGSNGSCSPSYLCTAGGQYDGPTGTGTLRGLRAIAPRACGFTDVVTSDDFAADMCWMKTSGISTGYDDGTYKALTAVHRDAMAAFMYRLKMQPGFTAPLVSPFTDLKPGDQFYKEISWLATTGISTGYDDGSFRPLDAVNRDAMAAFLYRLAGSPAYAAPAVSPFTDVATTNKFYREIAWLASTGISKGWKDGTYRPLDPVNRDAMAAFMNRFVTAFGR